MKLFIYSPTHSIESNNSFLEAIQKSEGSELVEVKLLESFNNFEEFLALSGDSIFLIHYSDLNKISEYSENRILTDFRSRLTILHTYSWDNDNKRENSPVVKMLDRKKHIYCFGSTSVLSNFVSFIENFIKTGVPNLDILKGYNDDFMNLFKD